MAVLTYSDPLVSLSMTTDKTVTVTEPVMVELLRAFATIVATMPLVKVSADVDPKTQALAFVVVTRTGRRWREVLTDGAEPSTQITGTDAWTFRELEQLARLRDWLARAVQGFGLSAFLVKWT